MCFHLGGYVVKAVIMAGGKGTRLRPLTCHVPKPIVPIMNKPVMEYSIEWLKQYGITDIAVTVQYLSDEIIEYFGDGRQFGVHLHYFEETTPLGTAGSVKHAQSFLDDTFVVISADTITTIDLPKLDEPTLTIYSQATNAQKAKEYTKYYIKKIRQYQNV